MQKTKSILSKLQNLRMVDAAILLLLAFAAAMLIYLFVDSLHQSRDITNEIKTKTSINQ
jgi:hypothetical protein